MFEERVGAVGHRIAHRASSNSTPPAADRAFHRLRYGAAGVPDLFDLVRQRSGHVDRLRMLNLPSIGKQRSIVRDHLSGTLGQVEAIRLAHPDYFTA
jgi:GntR family transcriptional regulator, rspAB operon transcriptional repressor